MRKSAEIASQIDLTSEEGIIRTINTIAIELEASIIKNEVDTTASLFTKILDSLPQLTEMISEDVLLSCGQVVTAGGLEGLDLIFRHIDE
jgi:hypothetical protein